MCLSSKQNKKHLYDIYANKWILCVCWGGCNKHKIAGNSILRSLRRPKVMFPCFAE